MKLDNPKVKTTPAWQMFGKRYVDLNETELKLLKAEKARKQREKHRKYNSAWNYENSFCFKFFGKRCKELSNKEKQEFNRLRQREVRKKKRIKLLEE